MKYEDKFIQQLYKENTLCVKLTEFSDIQASFQYFSSFKNIECCIDENFEYFVLNLK